MKCKNCGNELSSNALFCDNCGYEVNLYDETEEKLFCGNCGAEIENGAEFCGECGAAVNIHKNNDSVYIFCGNCGAKIPEGTICCSNCGNRLDGSDEKSPKSSNRRIPALIITLVLTAAALAAVVGGYIIWSSKEYDAPPEEELIAVNENTEQPAAVQSASAAPTSAAPEAAQTPTANESTAAEKLDTYYVVNCSENISLRAEASVSASVLKEIPLGAPVSYVEAAQNGFAKVVYNGVTGYALQSYLSDDPSDIQKANNALAVNSGSGKSQNNYNNVISDPDYVTYNDTDYSFTCAYPSHFKVYNDSDKFVRYSLKAPDDTAALKICATSNGSGLSVKKVMDNFKSSYPGTVDYENSGDTWCAVCTIQNGQCHYGYFHVTSSSIRGFELHYSQSCAAIYDQYVNDIYDSLKFN